MIGFDFRAADNLNRLLDGLVESGNRTPVFDAAESDPALARTAMLVQRRADQPSIDPDFAERTLRDILGARPRHGLARMAGMADRAGQGVLWTVTTGTTGMCSPSASLASFAATVALVLLTVASVWSLVGPDHGHWVRRETQLVGSNPSPTGAAVAGLATVEWEASGDPDSPFDNPGHVTIDPKGNLWVVDQRRGDFQILAPDGTFLERWGVAGTGPGEFRLEYDTWPIGAVAFARDGGFYVADAGNRRIQKFAPDRTFVLSWGEKGLGDGEFLEPENLALDAEGNVYVLDVERDDIQVFDKNGAYLRTIGAYGTAQGRVMVFFNSGLTIDPEGNLWVADASNQRVERFTPDGDLSRVLGGAGANDDLTFFAPGGIAIGRDGTLYVVDASPAGLRVQAISADGELLAAWQNDGGIRADLSFANSLALDDQGSIYVTAYPADRVLKLRLQPTSAATP